MRKVFFLPFLLLLLPANVLAQNTLFSDDFNDNNRNGWYEFNDDNGTRSLDASGGDLELVNSSFRYWGALANFGSVTLADGDNIKLSLDFRVIDNIESRNMTFGLYNSQGTTISADQNDLTNLTDESGYASYTQSDESRLVGHIGTGLGNVNGTANDDKATFANPPANPFSLTGSYTYSLTIENNSGSITVTQIFNEGQANELSQSGTSIGGDVFTFDTIAFQAVDKDFAVDNVVVTSTIPEPSSIALVGLALLAGLVGIRKARR